MDLRPSALAPVSGSSVAATTTSRSGCTTAAGCCSPAPPPSRAPSTRCSPANRSYPDQTTAPLLDRLQQPRVPDRSRRGAATRAATPVGQGGRARRRTGSSTRPTCSDLPASPSMPRGSADADVVLVAEHRRDGPRPARPPDPRAAPAISSYASSTARPWSARSSSRARPPACAASTPTAASRDPDHVAVTNRYVRATVAGRAPTGSPDVADPAARRPWRSPGRSATSSPTSTGAVPRRGRGPCSSTPSPPTGGRRTGPGTPSVDVAGPRMDLCQARWGYDGALPRRRGGGNA